MAQETSSLLLEDDISRAGYELFESLDKTATLVEQISSIKDPRTSSAVLPNSVTAGEESRSGEQAKVVTSQGRKDAFFRSLIHIPAIIMTLGALSLTFRGVFWHAPTSYTNTVLNILQMVAKVHETLIIASLTAIVFHRLRYETMGRNGIPFGLLSAALQYSSLQILIRKDFTQVLATPKQLRRYLGSVLIVILACLLALISGPSAAIAILPRLEWWPVPPAHNMSSLVIYLDTSAFQAVVTFPPQHMGDFTDDSYDFNQCLANTTNSPWCPSSGLQAILTSGMIQSLIDGDPVLAPPHISVSSVDLTAAKPVSFSRSLYGNLLRDTSENSGSLFVASVATDVVALVLGPFWWQQDPTRSFTRPMAKTSSTQNQVIGLQKPIVQVQCTESFHTFTNSTSDMILFPSTFHSPKATSDQPWTVPLEKILAQSGGFNDSAGLALHKWVNLDMPEETGPSGAAIFLFPETELNQNNTFACTIDARWIPSESWIDPTTDEMVHESITNPLEERYYFQKSNGKIQLSQSWLDALDVTTFTDSDSAFQEIVDFCTNSRPSTVWNVCIESIIALFVADGLARIQSSTLQIWLWQNHVTYSTPYSQYSSELDQGAGDIFPPGSNMSLDRMPRFTINILQYGYGYGFQGGKTIYFATTILLIYVLVALIHIIVVNIGGWSSDSWSKPGELIALAVNSCPNMLLQNTCAGIEDSKLWTRIVCIRETEEKHLEIVFDEEPDAVVDREFGRGKGNIETQDKGPKNDNLESRVRKRVIPGKKYGTLGDRLS